MAVELRTMALRTEAIILREPIPDDDEALVSIFTDPKTMRHLPHLVNQPWDVPLMAARRLARALEELLGQSRNFTVVLSESRDVIGQAVFKRLWEEGSLKRGELGLILVHEKQGRGLVWDVHLLLLTLGFEQLGLDIVEWITAKENDAMRAVLSKMECKDAGEWSGDHDWVKFTLEKEHWADCKAWLCEKVAR